MAAREVPLGECERLLPRGLHGVDLVAAAAAAATLLLLKQDLLLLLFELDQGGLGATLAHEQAQHIVIVVVRAAKRALAAARALKHEGNAAGITRRRHRVAAARRAAKGAKPARRHAALARALKALGGAQRVAAAARAARVVRAEVGHENLVAGRDRAHGAQFDASAGGVRAAGRRLGAAHGRHVRIRVARVIDHAQHGIDLGAPGRRALIAVRVVRGKQAPQRRADQRIVRRRRQGVRDGGFCAQLRGGALHERRGQARERRVDEWHPLAAQTVVGAVQLSQQATGRLARLIPQMHEKVGEWRRNVARRARAL